MTDALTTLAIVGTAHGGEPATVDDARADAVIAGLADRPYETRVLLAAGARAVASFAGVLPRRDVQVPAPADAETLRPCSPRLDAVVGEAIEANDEALMLEALRALASCGMRLPFARLMDAPKLRSETTRRAFAAVAGARGAWLARANPPLGWLVESESRSLDAHERTFTEEKSAARVSALETARAVEPARARSWLEATWGDEKAESRAALIDALAVGLSRDDEPFLEAALGDRSQGVRERAAALLARLPESAFVARLRTRADALFAMQAAGAAAAIGTRWPAGWDRADVRDGLVPSTNAGESGRFAYAANVAGALPPSYWSARFSRTPEAIVAAAREASGLIPGLAHAAMRAHDGPWLVALLAHFRALDPSREDRNTLFNWTRSLLEALPPEHASAEAARQLDGRSVLSRIEIYVNTMHWDAALGSRFLAELRRGLAVGMYELVHALDRVAHRLPAACFDAALEPLKMIDGAPDWAMRAHEQFQRVVRLRGAIAAECTNRTNA